MAGHDDRYTADQVCIIPGTAAVAGITRVDEPVAELLDRFEAAAVADVLASGAEPNRSPRDCRAAPMSGARWASCWTPRTCCGPGGRRSIGAPAGAAVGWQVHAESRTATNHSTGARLEVIGSDRVVLRVPLSGTWIDITFTLPPTVVDGGAPMVITADAAAAMRAVLAIAAGVDGPDALPALVNGSATVTVDWDPERVADHTGVTAVFGAPLAPTLTAVPDALVGRCWPAVFAAVGGPSPTSVSR